MLPEDSNAAPTTAPTTAPSKPSNDLSADMNAQIDAAMAAMDAADGVKKVSAAEAKAAAHARVVPSGGVKPAAVRGPRVVQAGREHRAGLVVSVGPSDIFVEFGPKELGVVPRLQYPDDVLPKVGEKLEVVVDKFEASENIFVCSRPGAVQKADWEMLEVGQVVEARVTGVAPGKDGKQAGIELEVAHHRAFMPASQVTLSPVPDLSVFVGEKLKCSITRIDKFGKGNIVLSRRDILDVERKELGEKLKSTLTEGMTVEGTVRKIMPFGAFIDLGGLDGLCHISDMSYDRTGMGEKAVEKFVKEGQKLNVRILKVDIPNNRISLGLKQVAGDPFTTATEKATEGAEVTGRITKIAEFGAFCEISPGVEGLIHISELDHKRVAKVEDILKPDQVVQVKVLKIDPGTRRISLSMKALKPLPEVAIGSGGMGNDKFGGKGKKDKPGRSAEEILKETPALRRAREKFKKSQFKGGLS